jgi:hypothetical protein
LYTYLDLNILFVIYKELLERLKFNKQDKFDKIVADLKNCLDDNSIRKYQDDLDKIKNQTL